MLAYHHPQHRPSHTLLLSAIAPAGTFLEHVQQSSLFTLVARARRFFSPGAAAEVYDLLRSSLVCGDPMGTSTHLALGWLVLFFPTKQLPQVEPDTAQVSSVLCVTSTAQVSGHQQLMICLAWYLSSCERMDRILSDALIVLHAKLSCYMNACVKHVLYT